MFVNVLGSTKRTVLSFFWLLLNYFKFTSEIKRRHGAECIRPFKIYNWHDGAFYFRAKLRSKEIFIKTDYHWKLLSNEVLAFDILSNDDFMNKRMLKPVFFDDLDYRYIAYEYIEFCHLGAYFVTIEDDSKVYSLLNEIDEIITHLRLHGIVHRDLKSDNFFVTDANELIVFDFFFAVSTDLKMGFKELDLNGKGNLQTLKVMGLPAQIDDFVWDDSYSIISMIGALVESGAIGDVFDDALLPFRDSVGLCQYRLSTPVEN